MAERRMPLGALRGLALGLTLSVVNLFGVFLTLLALGGLGEWTGTQFIGLFGLVEVATGAAFIIGPNIWHLPVSEARLARSPVEVQFAASTIFIPHWAGGVKGIAGFAFVCYAIGREGFGVATLGLPLIIVAVCAAAVGVSMVFARLGVARPDIDVYEIVVRRPTHPDYALPGISLGAAVVQLTLNIGTFPTVKILPPTAFYQPEFGPSPETLLWALAGGAALLGLGVAAWWGRLSWRAPAPQQEEAEEFARAG